ncbi:hypothetical protein E4U21_004042 [Claviceps maximensis]|nr:hypothetical protein E4U21_004042 [Claviceps maximensis]
MSTTVKRPPSSGVGVGRVATESTPPSPAPPPLSRSATQKVSSSTVPSRTRSVRAGSIVSARAAARRDSSAEAVFAVEDLQQRLQKEEKLSEIHKTQVDVLQSRLNEALLDAAKWEEKLHENEEQLEGLRLEKKDATRQIREMETIYEAERSAILKEKEELANREEEMQMVIQRLKDSLAQRNNNDDEARQSRPVNSSPSVDGGSFAPPSSLQRSDSRNNSKLILQKDKLIESLRLELAEAQIKLVESENQGGGRLQEVERMLMEARMANARLVEDNESYQLLLQEKTLKGDFGQSDFSYMSTGANQEALNALEGKTGGSSLADELSDATEAESENYRRLEADLKSMKEQNKALTLYINKIIERLLQHQDFESILDQSSDGVKAGQVNTNKDLPAAPGSDPANGSTSLLQRAKSMAVGSSKPKPRPLSFMPSTPNSAHTDPETAPSIPIGNRSRPLSSRPRSEQLTGGASIVSQMYRGPDGPVSPPLHNRHSQSHSQSFFVPPAPTSNPNVAARYPSGSQASQASSSNIPGMRSETSSLSGDSGDLSASTPPSQSPPRSHSDKQTTFYGGKPRPLRLVQENQDVVKDGKDSNNKRSTWYTGWSWGAKKDEAQPGAPPGAAPTNMTTSGHSAIATSAAIPE